MNPFNNNDNPKKPINLKDNKKGKDNPSFFNNIISTILIFLIIAVLYSLFVEGGDKIEKIAISELASDIMAAKVELVNVEGGALEITYLDETIKESKKEVEASLTETLKIYGVTPEQLSEVTIDIKSPTGFAFWFFNLAPFLIPVLFLVLFFWFISRQVKGSGGMQPFSFGQSKARMIDPNDKNQRILFKDVAGNKEAKEELIEIVDFLRNPKKFLNIGARIPKGVMLMGAPGTGKTLMARAVAGEAKVPFYIISGSEFVEMFVGVGASRVRDLFKVAKASAPSIIFVDEIDAVGRVRGTGVGGGNDEREQTLNQILVEMDGFEPHEKVIVMAATNRPDVLDPALLRPGRFDRRVTLDLPDLKDREEILKVHVQKKPLAEDINLHIIAERTPGFSGADLASLMNEAAILAAREDRKKVGQFDFVRSIEKVMLGPERKSHLMTVGEKKIVAYHEAGHALVASVLPLSDPVHKVTIISRGRAGGYTLTLPLEEKRLQSSKEFLDDLAMSLGGYVSEKQVFGDITTGPSNDLQVASNLARHMVVKYGMSEKIGPLALSGDGNAMFGSGVSENVYSEEMSKMVDGEVRRLMTEAHDRATEIIIKHRDALDAMANELLKTETLEREDYEKILLQFGIPLKKKKEAADPTATKVKAEDIKPVEVPKIEDKKEGSDNDGVVRLEKKD